jgi:hypothetical protein
MTTSPTVTPPAYQVGQTVTVADGFDLYDGHRFPILNRHYDHRAQAWHYEVDLGFGITTVYPEDAIDH